MEYALIGLTALITVVSALAPLRENTRLTFWGKALVTLCILAFIASLVQVRQNAKEREEAEFVFDPARSLQFELEAEYFDPLKDDSALIASVPKEIAVQYGQIGDAPLEFDLVRTEEVYRPVVSRTALVPARIYYHGERFRSMAESPTPARALHLWDFAGDTFAFRIQVGRFRQLSPGQKWQLRGSVSIGGYSTHGFVDDLGRFRVPLNGLTRSALKARNY